jgi:ankyrin repeat protein
MACVRGRDAVVKTLLDAGASVDVRDKEGRTALLFLASEKSEKLRTDTLRMLLEKDADIEARDAIGRTPLLWAATNGNVPLVAALLSGELGKKADISAANNRGRNALHLAAESNHVEMLKLLISHGADPQSVSDGGWTALHNAAQNGHTGAVALLLAENANVNAELSNGMTPLHWAAFNGHEEIVKLILAKPETNIAIKDSFDRTAMLCAAERHHNDLVQILSPARAANRLSENARRACKEFEATVVDFGNFRDGKKELVFKHSVYELLYGWDESTNQPKIPTLAKNIKYQPAFRWIHLPANNVS